MGPLTLKIILLAPVLLAGLNLVKSSRNYNVERTVETKCKIILGRTNHLYENMVSLDKPLSFVFEVDRKYIVNSHVSQDIQKTTLRVEGGTHEGNSSLRYPVMFAIRQERHISSFEAPFSFDDDNLRSRNSASRSTFYNGGHTLCIYDDDDDIRIQRSRNVTVRVTTQSLKPVKFYLTLNLTEDFQLKLDQPLTIDVSPTTPKFYGFHFANPDLKIVKIRATSNSTSCMTISIQTLACPIYDLEDNVRYKGLWQTMSTSAAMTVQKFNLYEKGFVLVLVAHQDSEMCGRKETSAGYYNQSSRRYGHNQMFGSRDPRIKSVELVITDESKVPGWILLLCLFIPIIATLITSCIVIALFRNRHEWMGEILRDLSFKQGNHGTNQLLTSSHPEQNGGTVSSDNEDEESVERRALHMSRIRPSSTIPPPASSTKTSGCGWKADMYIADFNCKDFYEVKKFTKRFYWTIGIVAIFYSIPVYQLVLHYLRVLYRTGEYDICYYNYLCAQRLGLLIDFNHFWSNASYVIFGIFFIVIVRRRSRNLCLPSQKKKDDDGGDACCCCCRLSLGKVGGACLCSFSRICFRWDHGVPSHFGVFYALGVALTMEGFLSAAYHLCPNQSTFQFDTCFMYVIAVLLLLKIYQFRHPIHFGANHTFAILAGFVLISVFGLIFERGTDNAKLIFKCIFLPFQYIVMLIVCIHYYAVGYVKNEKGELITDWSIFTNLGQLKSQKIHGDRLILPIISFIICVAVLVYSELSQLEFASYLLYVLVGNVLGTTLYYVGIMKPIHGEFKNWTWVQPTLYFLAAGVIGGFSLQYFVRAPAQWELSASASRAVNEDCLKGWFPFHPFYDSHDAWHFLSAAALFLAFMGLLIVDDDMITTPQTKIPVF